MSHFEDCLAVVLEHEGGYTNDPNDPGGPTNLGISMVEDVVSLTKLFGRPPTAQDIQSLTPQVVAPIYKQTYWDRMSLDQVTGQNISLCLFDLGVLVGCQGTARRIQGILGLTQDGCIGPQTVKALNSVNEREVCSKFLQSTLQGFESRVDENPDLSKFLPGWSNRVMDLAHRCQVNL